jgi:DNA polymerase elongation subunit (family B)
MKLKNIRKYNYDGFVYDLVVSKNHNFFANGAIVHNCAKKRYILSVHNSEGIQYSTPKLKVMGLEMVRSSTPALIKKKLKESIEVILEGDESKLHDFIEATRNEFQSYSISEISKPSGINNMLIYEGDHIYKKGCPIHVRGALLYNHHLKRLNLDKKYPIIQDGDKIKFVYVSKPNIFHEDIIAFPSTLPEEFGLEKYIDYDKQFEVVFLKAVSIIIDAIGWSLEETSTLEDFF